VTGDERVRSRARDEREGTKRYLFFYFLVFFSHIFLSFNIFINSAAQ